MPQGARFCTQCGSATRSTRAALRKSWLGDQAQVRRAALALAWLFAGSVAGLLLVGPVADRHGLLQACADLAIIWFGARLLGRGWWRRSWGGAIGVRDVGLGVAAGCLGFVFAHFYVLALWKLQDVDGSEALLFVSPLALVVFAPLFEEWVFRGLAWEAARRIGGDRLALWLT